MVAFPCFQPELVPSFIGDGMFVVQRIAFIGLAIAGGSFGALHKHNAFAQFRRQGIDIFTEGIDQPEKSLFV